MLGITHRKIISLPPGEGDGVGISVCWLWPARWEMQMLMPYPANTLIASPARWALWTWLAQTLHPVQEATTG